MKFNKKLLISALFGFSLFSFTPNAMADAQSDFAQAYQYIEQGNYHQAFPIFQQLAEQGYASVQFNLALMYENGQGVRQDYAQAVKWYKAAAEQGEANAQVNLGVMYANGEGVKQDYVQAVKWFKAAAEQGYAKGQFTLGVMYKFGLGVPQNDQLAKEWFGKACNNGDQLACDQYRELNEQGK